MPQTLMAILAMMTVTLASVNQQRALLESHRAMLGDELEVMASGIALQALEYIGTKSFDEATVHGSVVDVDDLTLGFPSDQRCPLEASHEGAAAYDTCNDLSDYHDMLWEGAPFVVHDDTIHFEVTADVGYLDQSHSRTSSATFNKEVVVTVRQRTSDAERPLLRQPITIARTYAY